MFNFKANVLLYVILALLLTTITAIIVNAIYILGILSAPVISFVGLGAMLLSLLIIVFINRSLKNKSTGIAFALYIVYSVLFGIGLSWVVLEYTTASIVSAFVATLGLFILLYILTALFKINLRGISGFLMLSLLGVIVLSIVNLVIYLFSPELASSFSIAISIGVVVLFSFITIRDFNQMEDSEKEANATDDLSLRKALVISSAISLYLDFINIFIRLLLLFGNRK